MKMLEKCKKRNETCYKAEEHYLASIEASIQVQKEDIDELKRLIDDVY